MEENKLMEGLNEGAVVVCEDFNGTNNTMLKVAVGAVAIAASVGAALYVRKKLKNRKAKDAEVVSEETVVENNDEKKKK